MTENKTKIKPVRITWEKPGPRGEYIPPVMYFPQQKVTVRPSNPDQWVKITKYNTY